MKQYKSMLWLALFAPVLLTACNQKNESKTADTGQAVVKVDGVAVSEQHLASAVARVPNVPKGQEELVEKQILNKMVEQQLFVKQALDKKLDQDPKTSLLLEAAKRQILAQAYFDSLTAQAGDKPTDAEIHEYYEKNPNLFAQRKVYKFAEMSVTDPSKAERVRALVKEVKSMEELAKKFHEEKIVYQTAAAVKGAEEVPLPMLDQISKMAKGTVSVLNAPGAVLLLQLQDTLDKPVTEEQAKPAITRFLLEQKRKALYDNEVAKLKKAAKIEFQGKFADMNKDAASTPAGDAAPTVQSGQPTLDQFSPTK